MIFIQQAGCFHLASCLQRTRRPPTTRSGPLATPMTCSGRSAPALPRLPSSPLPLPLLTSLHSALNDDHYPDDYDVDDVADDFWCFRWILDEFSSPSFVESYPLPDMTTMIIVKPSKAITAADEEEEEEDDAQRGRPSPSFLPSVAYPVAFGSGAQKSGR